MARLSVPIYAGGTAAAKVRAAKETLGQRRIELDAARDTIRQAVISAWGQLDAARAQIRAAQAQVAAENLVLSGVIEQQKVGQSTTLDVLNAQQDLLNARVSLISAQHDRVIASYSLLAAIGKLNAEALALKVDRYDPVSHYKKVRDKWGGLRTPGRPLGSGPVRDFWQRRLERRKVIASFRSDELASQRSNRAGYSCNSESG